MRLHIVKKETALLAVIASFSMMLCTCSDESPEYNLSNNHSMTFATSVQEWGVSAKQMEYENSTGSDTARSIARQQIIPIEKEDNIGLVAIRGNKVNYNRTLSIDSNPITRGQLKDEVSTSDKFCLAAYYDENGTERTFIDKQLVKWDHKDETTNTNFWKLDNDDETVYWKLGSQAITTYAWWPTNLSFNSTTKRFSYTIGEDPVNQSDFLYSYVKPTYYTVKESADITFKHALTAVQFVMGTGFGNSDGQNPAHVTKIELQNLYYTGEFDPKTEEWLIDKSKTRTFTLDIDSPVDMHNEEKNVVLNPDKYTLLMMPQDLGETPCLAIFYLDDGRTFRATLNHGGVWRPGETVRFLLLGDISVGYVIYATSSDATYNAGTHGAVSVCSYQLVGTEPRPQRWKVTGFSIDGGNKWNEPSATTWVNQAGTINMTPWVTDRNIEGISTGTGLEMTTKTVKVSAISDATTSGKGETINNALKNATAVSNYDLSTHTVRGATCSLTTANCYIVHAPGTYSFPTYYGSTYKNGSLQATAYGQSNFVNYKGNKINNANIITDTGASGVTAKIIWQERPVSGAISNVQYSDNKITFSVDRDKIYQGNVLIGLFDSSGKCMWSWHIWITRAYYDYTTVKSVASVTNTKNAAGTDGTYTSSTTYYFAPDPIGVIYRGRHYVYEQRQVMLRIQQVDDAGDVIKGSSTCKIYVTQNSGEAENRIMGFVYYQWGRKDPRPCATNLDKPSSSSTTCSYPWDATGTAQGYWDSSKMTGWTSVSSQISMDDAIKYPNIWKYRAEGVPSWDWCSTVAYNWWDAAFTKTEATNWTYYKKVGAITKTVYDPCPPGFHVPPSGAFAEFTEDKSTFGITNQCRYKDYKLTGGTLRAYITGYVWRTYGITNHPVDWQNYGYSWQSSAYTDVGYGCLYGNSSYSSSPFSGSIRNQGFVIIPVAD